MVIIMKIKFQFNLLILKGKIDFLMQRSHTERSILWISPPTVDQNPDQLQNLFVIFSARSVKQAQIQ